MFENNDFDIMNAILMQLKQIGSGEKTNLNEAAEETKQTIDSIIENAITSNVTGGNKAETMLENVLSGGADTKPNNAVAVETSAEEISAEYHDNLINLNGENVNAEETPAATVPIDPNNLNGGKVEPSLKLAKSEISDDDEDEDDDDEDEDEEDVTIHDPDSEYVDEDDVDVAIESEENDDVQFEEDEDDEYDDEDLKLKIINELKNTQNKKLTGGTYIRPRHSPIIAMFPYTLNY